MDLGSYANYPLPDTIKTAFEVETAQQLADKLGAEGRVSPMLMLEGAAAFSAYRAGDVDAARTFLKTRLGLTDATIDDALARLATA